MKSRFSKSSMRDSVNHSNSASIETQHSAALPVTSGWMEKIALRNAAHTISANELTSLSALIAYAAHKTGASEFRIERDLADRFNVANVKCLPAGRFDDALRYLVDQVPAQMA